MSLLGKTGVRKWQKFEPADGEAFDSGMDEFTALLLSVISERKARSTAGTDLVANGRQKRQQSVADKRQNGSEKKGSVRNRA